VASSDRNEAREMIRTILEMGEYKSNVILNVCSSSKVEHQLLADFMPQKDENGHTIGLLGRAEDVTARIFIDEEYAKLVQSTIAPIITIDKDGKIVNWNTVAEASTGFTSKEAQGIGLVEKFVQEEYREAVQRALAQTLTGVNVSDCYCPLLTKGYPSFIFLNE
jgi:PAS domain-containing protein